MIDLALSNNLNGSAPPNISFRATNLRRGPLLCRFGGADQPGGALVTNGVALTSARHQPSVIAALCVPLTAPAPTPGPTSELATVITLHSLLAAATPQAPYMT